VLLSIALQCGVPLDVIRGAITRNAIPPNLAAVPERGGRFMLTHAARNAPFTHAPETRDLMPRLIPQGGISRIRRKSNLGLARLKVVAARGLVGQFMGRNGICKLKH
jgi:hypothetical protein